MNKDNMQPSSRKRKHVIPDHQLVSTGGADGGQGSAPSSGKGVGQLVVLRRLRKKTTVNPEPKKRRAPKGVGRGNTTATGKKKQITIFDKEMVFQAFEKAQTDGYKVPIKEVEKLKLPGYYKGCLMDSKWGTVRRAQQWKLLVTTCPQLTKKAKELPNSIRRILNIETLKNSIHDDTENAKRQFIPFCLEQTIENMVMDRICLGEEVTLQFVKNTIKFAVELWNEIIETMRGNFRAMSVETLAQHDDRLANMGSDELNAIFEELGRVSERD